MKLIARLVFLAAFAAITGALASLAAIGFVRLINLLNQWLLISPRSRLMYGDSLLLMLATVAVPALGGLCVGLLWTQVKERRALGPPDVILSAQILSGKLPAKSSFFSSLGSIISLGCGASVGQYGPLVLMGAAIGSLLGGQHSAKKIGVVGIGCGAAAAIATAFNAPIAGLVFAHEVILRHYSIRAFAPVTVAATVGYLMANYVFEQQPLFHINPIALQHPLEYLGFIAIGIAGALVAITFMRAVLLAGKGAAKLPIPAYCRPMLAGAILGLFALWQPEILGIGSELLRFTTIEGAFGTHELALLIVLKILLTALCIGFGFAGGVFSPALLIGAMFGALAGGLADVLLVDVLSTTPRSAISLYAICGMVAVTSPVIGAPLTTILIIFELTRNYDLALACMVSVVFANLVGYRLFGRSLFDVQLARQGTDLSLGRDKAILHNLSLMQYVSKDYSRVSADSTIQSVTDELMAKNRTEAYVVDADGRYIGTITSIDIIKRSHTESFHTSKACDVARIEPLVFDTDTSIWQAMQQLDEFAGESIPVVDKTHHYRLAGVVYEAALVKAYLHTQMAVREEEHATL